MARLPVIDREAADTQTQKTFDAISSKFGMVPNIFKGMANSPAALTAYLQLDEIISGGSFSPLEQNVVRMVVSQYNECTYCVAAHTVGLTGLGLAPDDILEIRKGRSADPKLDALIAFTRAVLKTKGFVSDDDMDAFESAGFTSAHAAEIGVIIAQKTFSNLFNHINDTDLDLPPAPDLK